MPYSVVKALTLFTWQSKFFYSRSNEPNGFQKNFDSSSRANILRKRLGDRMTPLKDLIAKAKAATPGENWVDLLQSDGCMVKLADSNLRAFIESHTDDYKETERYGEFIAAASPDKVLALCEALERAVESLQDAKLHFESMWVSTQENGAPSQSELMLYTDKCNEECVNALAEIERLLGKDE